MTDNISNRERAKAVEEMFHLHARMISLFLYSMIGNWDDAAELAQETFVIAYRKLGDYDSARPAGAWLRGIARNLARNALRKRARHRRFLSEGKDLENIFSSLEVAEGDAGQGRLKEKLARCLKRLPARQRSALRLFYESEKSARDAAVILKVNIKTVYQLLWQARVGLRKCIESKKKL